ncbi:hypothetical protein F5Y10DRAFT_90788 [Nemania abortiva]|nr:hypothetical protein F5Y10DRAFT_90788 [Nemania abortiva]
MSTISSSNNIEQGIMPDTTCDLIRSITESVAQAFRPSFDALREDMREVSEGLREVNKGLREVSEGLREVHEGLREVSKGLREVHEDLREVHEGLRDVHEKLRDISGDLRDIREDLRDAHESLKQNTDEIKAINETAKQQSDEIKTTNQKNGALKDEIKTANETPKRTISGEINTVGNRLTKALDALDTRMAAGYNNNIAREMNGRAFQPDHKLVALHSVFTNFPIANFPKTLSELQTLSDETVVRILQELDDPFHNLNHGTPEEKWESLIILTRIFPL